MPKLTKKKNTAPNLTRQVANGQPQIYAVQKYGREKQLLVFTITVKVCTLYKCNHLQHRDSGICVFPAHIHFSVLENWRCEILSSMRQKSHYRRYKKLSRSENCNRRQGRQSGVWWCVSLRLGRNRPYHYDVFTSFAMPYNEEKKKWQQMHRVRLGTK